MSSSIERVFGRARVVLPVIHVTSREQAIRSAWVCDKADADGVFLIAHGLLPDADLFEIATAIKERFGSWVGVNTLGSHPFLDWDPSTVKVDGIWTDSAGVGLTPGECAFAERMFLRRHAQRWKGLYFGGIAHKGERVVAQHDLRAVCKLGQHYVDVVTTTGLGTGIAADVTKIREMARCLGSFPLALASGVTPENVRRYLPYVSAYLVATGISISFDEFDPLRVEELVEIVHGFEDTKKGS